MNEPPAGLRLSGVSLYVAFRVALSRNMLHFRLKERQKLSVRI